MTDSTASSVSMANALRALAMDAVQQANSGHPGAPMGMAEMAVALWSRHLRHNPINPGWVNRDRFVLSNGHASMLLYGLLHLSGYGLPMDEVRRFRQLHSKTPGHPEYGVTPGVETTTGPLGQGLANAVGMALAEKLLATEFNRDGHPVVDHRTYVFLGDGCLMEGVSHEAAALAGAWKLGKLVALYDDNGISIDGAVQPWFAEQTALRFVAYGWNVLGPFDGHDVDAIDQAITKARASVDKPTLIICKTRIGQGSPNRAGSAKAHGEPLGPEEIGLTRAALGWTHAPFVVPADVSAAWDARNAGARAELAWQTNWRAYERAYPELARELQRRLSGSLPADFDSVLDGLIGQIEQKAESVASRKASQNALQALTALCPELLGGSADLTGSNLTNTSHTPPLRFTVDGSVQRDAEGRIGRHINYGVREFGMAAIMNGVALHGGFIPYGGTFLTFSDYSRNAIRMAALMGLRVVHVFTHDSIGVGEDGPTHQPVEHAASLRCIPNLDVWRPADAVETAVAWRVALQNVKQPTALLLSRQGITHFAKPLCKAAPVASTATAVARGGYVVADPSTSGLRRALQAVLMASGSEVPLALQAQGLLAERGVAVRVVSMPSTTTFDRQPRDYQLSVLPLDVPRVAVEMGSCASWWKYGCAAVVGLDRFGESAPASTLLGVFGFTPQNVADTVLAVLARHN